MQAHPLAELFPMLPDAEIRELADNIVTFGQRVPIVLLDGMILDGRNRFAACQFADVEPVFVDYDGDDPLNFVLSHNLHRRHLTESQRAMVAAAIVDWKIGVNQYSTRPANLPIWKAARKFAVSARSVASARRVLADGSRVLVDAVKGGQIAVSAAAEIAKRPAKEQVRLLNATATRPVGRRLSNGKLLSACRFGDLPALIRRLEHEAEFLKAVSGYAANVDHDTSVGDVLGSDDIERLWAR